MQIKSVLDTRRANKDNKYPVKISIADSKSTVLIPTHIYTTPIQFDKDTGLLKLSDKKTKAINSNDNLYINSLLTRADQIVKDHISKGIRLSAKELRELLLPKKTNDIEKKELLPVTFTEYFKHFTNTKIGSTFALYTNTLNKIYQYTNNRELEFSEITPQWLMGFDSFMQQTTFHGKKSKIDTVGLKANTRSIQMRNIRAVLNSAIDAPIIDIRTEINNYPFRKFKIKSEDTVKRAMKQSHINMLFSYTGTPDENWAIDMAKIIFFTIGINVKDLYFLEDIDDDTLSYHRYKTRRLYNIFIEPELKVLLNKYKGSDGGLIFREQFQLKWFGMKINKYLINISQKIKIPKITTYSLRHTWATIAASLDIPVETIV